MTERTKFGKRCVAFILDSAILLIGMLVIGPLLGLLFGGLIGSGVGEAVGQEFHPAHGAEGSLLGTVLGGAVGFVAGGVVFYLLYFLIEPLSAATPGKWLLGIRVCRADGSTASLPLLLRRYAVKTSPVIVAVLGVTIGLGEPVQIVAGLLGLALVVGHFFALSPDRQTLHDKIANTAVYAKTQVQSAATSFADAGRRRGTTVIVKNG